MAFSKQRAQANLGITATNVFDVVNTSGVDLGNILVTNVSNGQIQLYTSVVPTGASMTSGNAIMWNVAVGASGFLSVSQPIFLASGDKLQGSGSAVGLNMYVTSLKLN